MRIHQYIVTADVVEIQNYRNGEKPLFAFCCSHFILSALSLVLVIIQVLADDDQRAEMARTPGLQHRLILDTAEGMAYLYNAGVEHRDLKSANCLVTHDWRAKVRAVSQTGTRLRV